MEGFMEPKAFPQKIYLEVRSRMCSCGMKKEENKTRSEKAKEDWERKEKYFLLKFHPSPHSLKSS